MYATVQDITETLLREHDAAQKIAVIICTVELVRALCDEPELPDSIAHELLSRIPDEYMSCSFDEDRLQDMLEGIRRERGEDDREVLVPAEALWAVLEVAQTHLQPWRYNYELRHESQKESVLKALAALETVEKSLAG